MSSVVENMICLCGVSVNRIASAKAIAPRNPEIVNHVRNIDQISIEKSTPLTMLVCSARYYYTETDQNEQELIWVV